MFVQHVCRTCPLLFIKHEHVCRTCSPNMFGVKLRPMAEINVYVHMKTSQLAERHLECFDFLFCLFSFALKSYGRTQISKIRDIWIRYFFLCIYTKLVYYGIFQFLIKKKKKKKSYIKKNSRLLVTVRTEMKGIEVIKQLTHVFFLIKTQLKIFFFKS